MRSTHPSTGEIIDFASRERMAAPAADVRILEDIVSGSVR